MSETTIIKLRQNEASYVEQNGSFKTTLNNPVVINKGDVIQFKNCFLDTSTDIIKLDQPKDIVIAGVRYLTNTKIDNLDQRFKGNHPGNKIYEGTYTGAGNGDGKKYFESITSTAVDGDEHALTFSYKMAPNSIRIKPTHFKFEYTDLGGNLQHFSAHEPFSLKGERVVNFNEKHPDKGISCRGTSFRVILPTKKDCKSNGVAFDSITVTYSAVKPTNGDTYLIPKVRKFEYTLPQGLYTPTEIAQILTDEMSRADSAGSIGNFPAIGNPNALFPVNSAFMGTIGQIANDDNINNTNTKFVAEDGGSFLGYNVAALNVPAGNDAFVGASETVIEFDPDTNKMRFKALHTPIYVGQNSDTSEDGVAGAEYIGTSGVSALQYSGFMLQALEPNDLWAEQLGVSAEIIPQFTDEPTGIVCAEAGNPMGAGLNTGTTVLVKSCSQVKEGITTTGVFNGLANPVPTSKSFFQPKREGDVASDILSTLFFDKIFNTGFATDGFFMIDIRAGITQDLRGSIESNFTPGVPVQDSRSIQAIVGSYYSNGNFTQAGSESSIVYEHKVDTPIILSEIETRVLLPDMSKPEPAQLGDRNTVFLEIIKPMN